GAARAERAVRAPPRAPVRPRARGLTFPSARRRRAEPPAPGVPLAHSARHRAAPAAPVVTASPGGRHVLPHQAIPVPRPSRSPRPAVREEAPGGVGRSVGRDQRHDDLPVPGLELPRTAKYRDMILDIGTEEIAHVEMLATMIARLLERASPEDQQAGASNP